MALSVAEMMDLRDALIVARSKGIRTAQIDGERIEYKTDAEMASAIGDLEARIRRASAPARGSVAFSSSKGL